MHQKLFFLFLAVANIGCKKEVNYPPEIRPNEFEVRYTLTDDNGVDTDYKYRGEDTTYLEALPGVPLILGYYSNSGIKDSIKHINSGFSTSWVGAAFTLRLYHPDIVTDPFKLPEWTKSEIENLIYPGKTFEFGKGPGQAEISLKDYPEGLWTCSSTTYDPENTYLKVLEVSDYGSPEIGVAYFGKKVRIEFSAVLNTNSGQQWTLKKGEAVLFFRYFTF